MIVVSLLAAPAAAHMPYVVPALFDLGARERVTVEASFTEDAFRPDIAMRDAPFEITDPAGRTTRLAAPMLTADRALAEAALPTDGLYRLSSGLRMGRTGKMFRRGDAWVMVGEGAAPPAGAALVDVRSVTLADAYVLRGKPGATGALTPRGKGLEIHPLGDPTAVSPGRPARFAILYEGKPVAGEQVTLFREAGLYDGRKQAGEMISAKDGAVTFTPPDAGRYLMLVRHRTELPAVSEGHASFTATLAFEAG